MSIELVNRRGVLRAVVVDAQPLWRSTLAAVLSRLGVGSTLVCESPGELAELLRLSRPHLVVLDSNEVPGAIAELRAAQGLLPHLTTVLVSARRDLNGTARGIEVAARVTKCSELEEIEAALHDVIREQLDWAALTPRELEILTLVADGASNREVAKGLWLSDQTVKFHLANTYRKLGVSTRRQAVDRARELGLLEQSLDDEIEHDDAGESEVELVDA